MFNLIKIVIFSNAEIYALNFFRFLNVICQNVQPTNPFFNESNFFDPLLSRKNLNKIKEMFNDEMNHPQLFQTFQR